MSSLVLHLADLVAVGVLVFVVYFPRHHRKDLLAAFLGVNVGVLAVASALSTSSVGAGLGLGLFGVLSIIRLRSTELAQHEVAFYFASLALGLLGGLGAGTTQATWSVPLLMALVVLVMWGSGHPRLFRGHRHTVLVLDRAFTDESALTAHLEGLLGARVHQLTVQRVDLVDDTTLVDVRYQRDAATAGRTALEQLPADATVLR